MNETPWVDDAARMILTGLIHSVWLGIVISGAYALVQRWTATKGRGNAATRYAVLSMALLALVVGAILTTAVGIDRPREESDATPAWNVVTREPSTALDPGVASAGPAGRPVALESFPSHPRLELSLLTLTVVRGLVAIWLLWAFVLLVRLGCSAWALRGLDRRSVPAPTACRLRLEALRERFGIRRPARLVCSDEIGSPAAAGLAAPMILLPSSLPGRLQRAELDQVLLHESAHIERRDDWTQLMLHLVRAVLFFNPAAWWIGRRMELEREVACDDWVIALTGQPRSYASCLTRLVELRGRADRPFLATGVATDRKQIFIRVGKLLEPRPWTSHRLSLRPLAGIATVLAFGLVVAAGLSPSIALPRPDEPTAASDPRPTSEVRPAIVSLAPAQSVESSGMSVASWEKLFRSVAGIASSTDRTSVLVEASSAMPADERVHIAYIRTAATIPSSSGRVQALTALIRRDDLSKQPQLELLDAIAGVPSSTDRTRVLLELLETDLADDDVRDAFIATVESLPSSSDAARVLAAYVRADRN